MLLLKSLVYLLTSLVSVIANNDSNLSKPNPDPQYDYYYDDSVPVIDLSFHKCHCGQDQVWDGSKCHSLAEEQLSNVTSQIRLVTEQPHQTRIIANIREKKCTTPLPLLPAESFVFLSSDSIYHEESHSIFNSTDFCLEYQGTPEQAKVVMEPCFQNVVVPLCCDTEDCPKPRNISIHFGERTTSINEVLTTNRKDMECPDIEKQVLTDKKEAFLQYSSSTLKLLVRDDPDHANEIIPVENFCLVVEPEKALSARFCHTHPSMEEELFCKNHHCIKKCCPPTNIYDMSKPGCAKSHNDTWIPQSKYKNSSEKSEPFHMLYGYPWCSHHGLYELDPKTDPGSSFELLPNGSIHILLSSSLLPFSKFCIDNFKYSDGRLSEKALVCFEPPSEEMTWTEKCKEIHAIVYPILIIVSCTFLAITLVVYGSVSELHANLHGKCLLSHVTSLLAAYVCQLIVSWNSKGLNMLGCKIIALGTQMSFLWAFFWLNVMCFDIWWTLKSMSPSPESWETSRRRFILYSIYAWGCPLFIGGITALMQFLPQLDGRIDLILPGFGVRSCWFQDTRSTWIYFHGFTLLLYVANIFFFFHVAAILIMSQRSTEGLVRITRKQYQERVFLYLKLFVVMGITWVCEVASWQEGTCEYWIFTDILNSLQGVFLFLIFMCNKKVFMKVHGKTAPFLRRFTAIFKTLPQPTNKVNSHSSSSQRTTQTSVGTSSRRLSTSSTGTAVVRMFLHATKSVESDIADLDQVPSSNSLRKTSSDNS